jgi:WD40 repeat protein
VAAVVTVGRGRDGPAFHPSGDLLLSGSAGGYASLWDLSTGEVALGYEGRARPGEQAPLSTTWRVHDLAFSPDGQTLLSGSLDNTLRLWSLDRGAEIRRFGGQALGERFHQHDSETACTAAASRSKSTTSLTTLDREPRSCPATSAFSRQWP